MKADLEKRLPQLELRKRTYDNLYSNFSALREKLDSSLKRHNLLNKENKDLRTQLEKQSESRRQCEVQISYLNHEIAQLGVVVNKLKQKILE